MMKKILLFMLIINLGIHCGFAEEDLIEENTIGVDRSLEDSQNMPIRIAITSAVISDRGMPIYEEMLNYISEKIGGREVEMVKDLSYVKIINLLNSGKIQAGFIYADTYVLESEGEAMELLAAPVMNDPKYLDRPISYFYVIVPKNSTIESFWDLKGKKYLYPSTGSDSKHNLPRFKLAAMGYKEEDYFAKIDDNGSAEKAIELVARGVYQGAAVNSLIWDYDNKFYPKWTNETRIIEMQGPLAIAPVVVPRTLSPELKEKLKEIFLNMHHDPKGEAILKKVLLAKFVEVEDSDYDNIRDMKKYTEWFLKKKTIPE